MEEKPKVLLINCKELDNFEPLFSFIKRDKTLKFSVVGFPTYNLTERLANERISSHLMGNKYSLVLIPDTIDLLDSIKKYHSGKVFGYGVNGINGKEYDNYLNLNESSRYGNPYRLLVENINLELRL